MNKNLLYLCEPKDAIECGAPYKLLPGTEYRWLWQGGEDWFKDSSGADCWVFQLRQENAEFEASPETYPNGVDIVEGNGAPWEIA